MRFDGKVSVSVIANQITRMTGVPVSLAPDVFMPLSSFIKGTSSNMGTQSRQQRNGNTTRSGGGRQAANDPVSLQALNAGNARIPPPIPGGALGSLPPLPGMANFDEQAEKYVSEMELNYTGTLVGLLDLGDHALCTQLGAQGRQDQHLPSRDTHDSRVCQPGFNHLRKRD